VFSAAPVEHDGRLQGYLYVILGGEAYDSVAGRLQGSYVFQLNVVVVAGLLFALLTRRLRRPGAGHCAAHPRAARQCDPCHQPAARRHHHQLRAAGRQHGLNRDGFMMFA
jgi:hypothetical protein